MTISFVNSELLILITSYRKLVKKILLVLYCSMLLSWDNLEGFSNLVGYDFLKF